MTVRNAKTRGIPPGYKNDRNPALFGGALSAVSFIFWQEFSPRPGKKIPLHPCAHTPLAKAAHRPARNGEVRDLHLDVLLGLGRGYGDRGRVEHAVDEVA